MGTMLHGDVKKRFGCKLLCDKPILMTLKRTTGSTFDAFLARGVTFEFRGKANLPWSAKVFPSSSSIIIMKTKACMHGAAARLSENLPGIPEQHCSSDEDILFVFRPEDVSKLNS